jgi:hypothetical protein
MMHFYLCYHPSKLSPKRSMALIIRFIRPSNGVPTMMGMSGMRGSSETTRSYEYFSDIVVCVNIPRIKSMTVDQGSESTQQ